MESEVRKWKWRLIHCHSEHSEESLFALQGSNGARGSAKYARKEIVETGNATAYTVVVMNAQLANSYYWYRFTWHPSGWRGASL